MSTRSRIGIIRKRRTPLNVETATRTAKDDPERFRLEVESVYCHFDGYPSGVGRTLLEHWTDPEKVNRLIALGDLSVLGAEIGKRHDFDSHLGTYNYETGEREGSSVPAGENWTLAYGRDRGEKGVGSVTHPLDEWPDSGQEAEYLFDPETREWRCRPETLNPVGWNTVAQWEGWLSIPEAIERDEAEVTA